MTTSSKSRALGGCGGFQAAARIALSLGGVLLTACTLGPNFSRPDAKLPAHWPQGALQLPAEPASASAPMAPIPAPTALPAVSAVTESPADLIRWWRRFNDAELDSLIERALRGNLDLRAAVLRSQEALAQRDITAAGLWPTLTANAAYDRERISETTPQGVIIGSIGHVTIPGVGPISIPNPYNQVQLGGTASWEPDLFGRLRRSVEAANATAQVSLEDQRAVRVSLLAQVAQSYLQLRGAQARRAVALEDIATLADLLQLTSQRRQSGLTTELDVRNAAAQLSQTRSTLPVIEQQIAQAIHQLSILLGVEPESLRSELEAGGTIPPVPTEVPIGLPAELARQRPDIRESEANLHAATAQIGVSIADLFPRLTLSASGGFQSQGPGNLLYWNSLFYTIGPELDIPIFDRGRWRTVRLYRLRAKEAAVSYQSTVLNALHEVEDAATALSADQQQRRWLTDTVAQNREAVALARMRYESGVSDFLNVLDAERTLQSNELSLLTSTSAASSDLVSLYRALGGGWGDAPAATPAVVSAPDAPRR